MHLDTTFVDFTGNSTLGSKYPRYSILQNVNTWHVLSLYLPFLVCRFPVLYLSLGIIFSAYPCPNLFKLYCCNLKIGIRNLLIISVCNLRKSDAWITLKVLRVHFLSHLGYSHHQLLLLQKSYGAIRASCIPLAYEVSILQQRIQLPNHRYLALHIFRHLLGVGESAWGLVPFVHVSKMVLNIQ